MNMPIENRPSKHLPLLYLFDDDFIEPARPATPNNKNTIEDTYNPINDALTADWLALLIIDFFSTWT